MYLLGGSAGRAHGGRVTADSQLEFDDFLELNFRLGAVQKFSVDEKTRRPGHTSLGPFLHVFLDLGLEAARRQASLE